MSLNLNSQLQETEQVLPPDNRMSKDAVTSIFLHAGFQLGASMSGIFLSLYLWRLTHSFLVNGLYYVILFAMTSICFVMAGWIVKKRDALVTFRIGIGFHVLFYLLVIVSGEAVGQFFYLFAIIHSLANGFYWMGYLTLMYDVSNEHNRIRYLALNSIAFTSAGLVGPALAGFVISHTTGLRGYLIVFTIAFILFFITTIFSFRIRSEKTHHRTYYLKMMVLLMRKNNVWLRSLYGYLVIGLLQGIMLFVPNLLLYQVIPREDIIGYLGVLFSGTAMLTAYGMGRWSQSNLLNRYTTAAAIGFTLAALMIIWKMDPLTVVIFVMLYQIFTVIQNNSMTNYYYHLTGKLPLKGALRVESIILREIFVNIGRVFGIGTTVIFVDQMNGPHLPIVLLVFSIIQFSLVFLNWKRAGDEG